MKQKIGELVKNNSCSLAPVSQEACSSLAFPHLVSPHSSHPLKLLATQPTRGVLVQFLRSVLSVNHNKLIVFCTSKNLEVYEILVEEF